MTAQASAKIASPTPRPWRVEQGTDLIWGACNPDDQSSYGMGYPIAKGRVPSWEPFKPSNEERYANAAFIVKCVNSHDTLVKALEYALEQLEAYKTTSVGVHHAAIEQARAALSSLKEK